VSARLAAVVLLLMLALGAAPALGDGDPASDSLVIDDVFFPYPAPSKDARSMLAHAVEGAYAHHYRLKVAVIASTTDLGAVPSLFDRPNEYAKFLGQEVGYYYIGPLLIAMPAGYGIYDGGRSTAAEAKVLGSASLHASSADDLTKSAAAAVKDLIAARALVSKDIKPPYASPFRSEGSRGARVKLKYTVFDDSGWTRETITVRAGAAVIATLQTPLRRTRFGKVYTVTWRAPARPPAGKLALCVKAKDGSGHRSAQSCIDLRLR
jgi:hypothetical protein